MDNLHTCTYRVTNKEIRNTSVRSDDLLGLEMGTLGHLTACLSQPSSEPKGCNHYVADDFIPFSLSFLLYPFHFPSLCIRDRRHPLLFPSSPTTANHIQIDALRHLPPPPSPFGANTFAFACFIHSHSLLLSLPSHPSSPFIAIAVPTCLIPPL